jgi:hypothetical protein
MRSNIQNMSTQTYHQHYILENEQPCTLQKIYSHKYEHASIWWSDEDN